MVEPGARAAALRLVTAPAAKSATAGAHLAIAGLTKTYGPVTALAPTDLEVAPGEFFSLIGPSGSGKSTLLGAIAGFVPPSAGAVRLDGVEIQGIPPYQRNIGMVFQNYALFPHMNVAANIAFPLRMRRMPRAEIAARVARMLDIVRLPGFADRMPAELSGGQQQRVALARAAVYDPPLLLMDEPLGALDKNLREEMQYEIKKFHAAVGATVLYVTHDQDEAATMSDRIAILDRARIVQVGRPRELYEGPRNAFVASFLGEANLFRIATVGAIAAARASVETTEGVTLNVARAPETSGALVACVRPESIAIGRNAGGTANTLRGTVVDVVYTAGTLRYRVEVAGRQVVAVRMPSTRQAPEFEVGSAVHLSWDAADTLLIPLE